MGVYKRYTYQYKVTYDNPIETRIFLSKLYLLISKDGLKFSGENTADPLPVNDKLKINIRC